MFRTQINSNPSGLNTSPILVDHAPPPSDLCTSASSLNILWNSSPGVLIKSQNLQQSRIVFVCCCLNKLWTGTTEPARFLADIQPEKSSVKMLQLRGCFDFPATAAAAVLSVPCVQPVVCLSLPRNPSLLPGKVGWGLQPPTTAVAFLCHPGEKRLTSDLSA